MLCQLRVLLQRQSKSVFNCNRAYGSYCVLEETEAHRGEVGPCGRDGAMQGLEALPSLSSDPSSQAKPGDQS